MEIKQTKAAKVDFGINLYSDYVAYLDAKPRTVQTYKGNLRQFFKWLEENGIENPTRADVLQYRDELKERLKPATVNGYITTLRLFFSWTSQSGLYPNIADHIKGAKLDAGHKKDYLTAEQMQDVLTDIDRATTKGRRDYAIVLLMVTGGLRDIEVSRANIEDIQTIGGVKVLFVQGKGRDDRNEFIKLPTETALALKEYLKDREPIKDKKAPLFVSLSNNNRGQRISTKSISTTVKSKLVGAGYDSPRLTAHSLRHTAVTLSLKAGIPLQEVQQFARHKSIVTTQIYEHDLERIDNHAAAAIAATLFKQKAQAVGA